MKAATAASFFAVFVVAQAAPTYAAATYPDRIPRAATREQPAALSWVPGLPNLPTEFPSWIGSRPDRIDPPRGLGVARQQFLARPEALGNFPVPHLGWQPNYPDRTLAKAGLRADLQRFLSPARPPDVWWLPVYPSRVEPPRGLQVHHQQFLARPEALGNLAIPELSWQPTYPGPQFSLRITPTEAKLVQLIAAPQAPDLSWSPTYPGPRFTRLITPAGSVLTQVVQAPPAPDLSWHPEYPSILIPRKQAPASQLLLVELVAAPVVTPLSWHPGYPDQLRRTPSAALLYYRVVEPVSTSPAPAPVPVPPDRIVTVPAEIRGYLPPYEDRSIILLADPRSLNPASESRVIQVPAAITELEGA